MTKMPKTRLEKRAGSEFFSHHRRFRVCSSSGKLLFFVEQPQLARDNKDESGRSSPYVKE